MKYSETHWVIVSDASDAGVEYDIEHPTGCSMETDPEFGHFYTCWPALDYDGIGDDMFEGLTKIGRHAFRSWASGPDPLNGEYDGGVEYEEQGLVG